MGPKVDNRLRDCDSDKGEGVQNADVLHEWSLGELLEEVSNGEDDDDEERRGDGRGDEGAAADADLHHGARHGRRGGQAVEEGGGNIGKTLL